MRISFFIGVIFIAIYLLYSRYNKTNGIGYRRFDQYDLNDFQSKKNELAVVQAYVIWRGKLFEAGRQNKGYDLFSLIVKKPSTNHKTVINNIETRESSRGKSSESAEIQTKNVYTKKTIKDHKIDSTNKKKKIKTRLKKPVGKPIAAKKNKGESVLARNSLKNNQNRETSRSNDTYTGIPIGYNQIQNQLNSLVRKDNVPSQKKSTNSIISGSMHQLILDETRTNIGGDFYTAFNNQWQSLPENANYTIIISEKPLPSLGTMVSVTINNEIVYQTRLNPNNKYINWIAGEAVLDVRRRLQNQQISGY